MNMKEHILTALMDEFNKWEELIRNMGDDLIARPLEPSKWTTKDMVAHLTAWQLRSTARMEASLKNHEPDFPIWVPELDPDAENNTDITNNWIYDTYRGELWPKIYKDWRDGYLEFVEVGDEIPERDLLDASKYAWMGGFPLALILISSYEHHHEHYEILAAWLKVHEKF